MVDRARLVAIASQAMSSAGNVALAIVVAHFTDAAAFGRFAIVFTLYVLCLGLFRASTTEALLVRSRLGWAPESSALADAVACSVGAALVMAVVSLGNFAGTGVLTRLLAIGLPFLLMQDCLRFVAFSRGRPATAFTIDAMWTVSFVAAATVCMAARQVSADWFLGVWSGGAAVATAVGVRLLRVPIDWKAQRWYRATAGLWRNYVVEYVGAFGILTLLTYVLSIGLPLQDVAGLRVATTVLGPAAVLMAGWSTGDIATAARSADRAIGMVALMRGGALRVGAVALWAVLALAIPRGLGVGLFSASWLQARTFLLPYGVGLTLIAVSLTPLVLLRVRLKARLAARLRLVGTAITVASAVIGVHVGGALGLAWGLAAGNLSSVVLLWFGAFMEVSRFVPPEDRADHAPSRAISSVE